MTSVRIVLLVRKLWSADSAGWTGLKRPCIVWLAQRRACNNTTNLLWTFILGVQKGCGQSFLWLWCQVIKLFTSKYRVRVMLCLHLLAIYWADEHRWKIKTKLGVTGECSYLRIIEGAVAPPVPTPLHLHNKQKRKKVYRGSKNIIKENSSDLTCSMDLRCSNGWSLTGLLSIFLLSLLSPVLLLTVYMIKQAVQQLSIHHVIPVSREDPSLCVWAGTGWNLIWESGEG